MSDTMGDAPIGYLVALPGKPFAITVPVEKMDLLEGHHNAPLYLAATPAPPVPQTVQEITRLIQPYVAACLKFNYTPMELIEQAEADVNAAFKPIEAAITALVEKNHELQFSLDGVNAMRGPLTEQQDISGWWNSVKDSGAWSGAIVGLEWAELWPEAQDMLKALVKATHGIEPEQGESHER